MNDAKSDTKHGSITRYVVGFGLALVLTMLSFAIVIFHVFHDMALYVVLGFLASVQLYVQLYFFLHLGKGRDKYWNYAAFVFMLIIVFIVVVGSIWIMNNLNYNMMSPELMDAFMKKEADKGF